MGTFLGASARFFHNGSPLQAGKVYVYNVGTTDLKAIYTDFAMTTSSPNPAITNENGEVTIFWRGDAKVRVDTSGDTEVLTAENVQVLDGLLGSSFLDRAAALIGSTGTENFITVGGLRYKYDASGTALTTGDLRTWSPAGDPSFGHFGAVGDNLTDDTVAVNACITYAKDNSLKIMDTLTDALYKITSTIDFRSDNPLELCMSGSFIIHHNGVGVILGGFSNIGIAPDQMILGAVVRDAAFTASATANPDVRATGAYGQIVTVHRCDYFQMYSDSDSSTDGKSSNMGYSTINIKRATTLELTNNTGTDGTVSQWINDNIFNLNRVNKVLINGTYSINNNRFYGGAFENTSAEINIQAGNSNHFYDVRAENAPSGFITFAAGTFDNHVHLSWVSTLTAIKPAALFVVSDAGTGNSVTSNQQNSRQDVLAYRKDVTDYSFGAEKLGGFETRQDPSFADLRGDGSSYPVCASDYIPVMKGDILNANAISPSTSKYRFVCYVFDQDRNPLARTLVLNTDWKSVDTPAYSALVTTGIYGSNIQSSTGVDSMNVLLLASDIAYVRVCLYPSPGDILNQTAYRFNVVLSRSKSGDYPMPVSPAARGQHSSVPIVTGIPTKSMAPLGYRVGDEAGMTYTCALSLDTALTVQNDGTDVTLDSVTGVLVADLIGIVLDGGAMHWDSVASIVGSDIVLTTGLVANAASAGNRVHVTRWV